MDEGGNYEMETAEEVNKQPSKVEQNMTRCPVCGIKFVDAKFVEIHMHFDHPDERTGQPETRQNTAQQTFFECDKCPGLFRLWKDLDNHIRDIHINKYRCHICNTSCADEESLKKHIEEDWDSIQNCNDCYGRRNNEVFLRCHTFQHDFACIFCGQIFTNQADLYVHIVREHDDKNFSDRGFSLCPMCFSQARFSHLQEFVMHCQIKHPEVYPFSCDTCGQIFQTWEELRNHVSVHEPDGRKQKYSGLKDSDLTREETKKFYRNLSTSSTVPAEYSNESSTDERSGFREIQHSASAAVSTPIPSNRSSIAQEQSVTDFQEFHTSSRPASATVCSKTTESTTFAFTPPIPTTSHSSSKAKRLTSSAEPQSRTPKRRLTNTPSGSSSTKRPCSSTPSAAGRPSSSMEKGATSRGQSTFSPSKSSPDPPSPDESEPLPQSASQILIATTEKTWTEKQCFRQPKHSGRFSGTKQLPLQEKKSEGSPELGYCPRCGLIFENKSESRNHQCKYDASKI